MSRETSHCPINIFPSIFFVLLNSTPKHIRTGLTSIRVATTSLISTPGKPSLTAYLQCQLYAEDVVSVCLTQGLQILYCVSWVQNRLGKSEASIPCFLTAGAEEQSSKALHILQIPAGWWDLTPPVAPCRSRSARLFPWPHFQGQFSLNASHICSKRSGTAEEQTRFLLPWSHRHPWCSPYQHGDCTRKYT